MLNTFKGMVADDDFLEKEDMYILDRMKELLLQDVASKIAISKQLVILIDRAVGSVSLSYVLIFMRLLARRRT